MADEHLMSLQPGTVIAGRYEVIKCLGQGSMGLVYACRHKELSGHLVAVKVLFPEVAHDKVAAARFRNEIFASYDVSHPNVVRAYDYVRDGDLVAYTMEFVGGGDLAERLGRPDEPITISDVADILSQMCLGVQAIHDAGIVHRDLKPENILLTQSGQVKIADFGIARTDHGQRLTEHGGVVGTIDYVSPEYMLNSQVDWRSDIYAIGILAYEMVTGESPFRGDSVYATMTKRLKTDPKPPSELRPDCPPDLDRVILKAMARDPEVRYQSAAEMYYDLQAFSVGQGENAAAPKLSRSASERYEGPRLSDDETDGGADMALGNAALYQEPPRTPFVENPAAMLSTPTPVPNADPYGNRTQVLAPPDRGWGGRDLNSDQTQIVPAGMIPGAPSPNTVPAFGAERMQSVLSRDGLSYSRPGTHVSLSGGMIDDNRVQRLSQLVDTVNRSIWVDVVTWLVAVLIGVGVGFAFLKVFFPELITQPGSPELQAVRSLSDF